MLWRNLEPNGVFPFVFGIVGAAALFDGDGGHLADAVVGEVDGGVAETLDGRGVEQRRLQEVDDVALVEDGHIKLEMRSRCYLLPNRLILMSYRSRTQGHNQTPGLNPVDGLTRSTCPT